MLKSAIRVAVVCALALTPGLAQASNSSVGCITNITMEAAGVANFTQDGTRTTRPACATDARWTLDGTTASGQARLAALLTAYATGKRIVIIGTGACVAPFSTIETINYFTIQD
ncbi:hypothetical protein Q4610_01300 [Sphingobium sp. HBC34]|uniref:Secreted protein n=1 Tax=Sphingobium cyanobacteriorum TaxID=3063954 RepID=A0ABT8ZGK3_9SPHN|nr:hypothetical protein [Sphingobium sp. HBC34]MDO7833670.1 hypothetical protein [Sphingobium sp. HBC34]